MSADNNLNLGGNAERFVLSILSILGTFFICMDCMEQRKEKKNETEKFGRTKIQRETR